MSCNVGDFLSAIAIKSKELSKSFQVLPTIKGFSFTKRLSLGDVIDPRIRVDKIECRPDISCSLGFGASV